MYYCISDAKHYVAWAICDRRIGDQQHCGHGHFGSGRYAISDGFAGQVKKTKWSTTSGSVTQVAEGLRAFGKLGRLAGLNWNDVSQSPVAPIERYAWRYDAYGRRDRLTVEDDSPWSYAYDDMGQLLHGIREFPNATFTPGGHYGYSYDSIGNRTATIGGGDVFGDPGALYTSSYTANLLNQYTERDMSGNVEVFDRSNAATPLHPQIEPVALLAVRTDRRAHPAAPAPSR
jgi:hypothetical protein